MDDTLSTEFFLDDLNTMASEAFVSLCRNGNPQAFTRNRKMPLQDLLLSILVRKGKTLYLDIRDFLKAKAGIAYAAEDKQSLTVSGYLKQRLKLNPEAFRFLYLKHNHNFYTSDGVHPRLINGHLILAADGSYFNVPDNPETREAFGTRKLSGNRGAVTQIGVECIRDVMNKFIIDCALNKGRYSERNAVEEMLENVPNIIGDKFPYVALMDRGYPSIPLFLNLIAKKIKFVVRLSSGDFKHEQETLLSNDEYLYIEINSGRLSHYRNTDREELVSKQRYLPLRMVRIKLGDGSYEYLVTNLSRSEFSTKEIQDIYTMRWGVETSFCNLKDRLQIENFTGTKPILIQQDIYSTIYLHNLAEHIIRDIEDDPQENHLNTKKHPMQVNRSICYGLLKDDLIHIFLDDDKESRMQKMRELYDDIASNVLPVRKNRHFARKPTSRKYSQTHKRCF